MAEKEGFEPTLYTGVIHCSARARELPVCISCVNYLIFSLKNPSMSSVTFCCFSSIVC